MRSDLISDKHAGHPLILDLLLARVAPLAQTTTNASLTMQSIQLLLSTCSGAK